MKCGGAFVVRTGRSGVLLVLVLQYSDLLRTSKVINLLFSEIVSQILSLLFQNVMVFFRRYFFNIEYVLFNYQQMFGYSFQGQPYDIHPYKIVIDTLCMCFSGFNNF
jgi:hypothetical protein